MKKYFYFFLTVFLFFSSTIYGKNILILNGSSGLGKAISNQLHQENDSLFLTARDTDKLILHENDVAVQLDFTKEKNDLSKKLKGQKLDGIVVITPRPRLGADYLPTADAWRQCFEEGFIGPLEALRLAIPKLKQGGKIVIIGGLTSVSALDKHQHYSVLRMMWLGQAKGLSRVLAKDKIHVNTIALGGTLTDRFKAGMETRAKNNGITMEQELARETDNIPLKQYAMPEQVGKVVSFLLSSQSDHITGVNIPMDGGFHRSY